MIKNKKLLIALICFAFCVCCAIIGFGIKSKNSIVAKADTIQTTTTSTASATIAKFNSLATHEVKTYQAIADEVLDKPEENQDITYEEDIETEEPEEEIIEGINPYVEPVPLPSQQMYVAFDGYLKWIDDYNKEHPLRQVKMQFNNYITYTDDNGYFYLRELFTLNGATDIVAYAVDENENVQVTDSVQRLYKYVLISSFSISKSSYTLNLPIDMDSESGQAFQILQAVITARDFAKEMMGGEMPSPVTVRYPLSTHAYYYEGGTIHLTNAVKSGYPHSYASWDLIMHEYGHHIQTEQGNGELLGKTHDSRLLDSADYGKDIGIRLAWSESWPTVFGMIAQKYYTTKEKVLTDIKTVGDSSYTAYNGIDYDLNSTPYKNGESCECSIMAVLWDLFDDDIEENDTIALGYQEFWDITTKRGAMTFSDFIQNFYKKYPELSNELGANLSYYGMASKNFTVTNISLNTLPEFTWRKGGCPVDAYENNIYTLKLYDSNSNLLFSQDVPYKKALSPYLTYTLNESQWNQILLAEGSYFYWEVEEMNDYEGIVTGPYFAQRQKAQKSMNVFSLGLNRHIQITSNEVDCWFKFVAPASGTFTFYTEGGSDTYGEVYSQIYNCQNYFLASDDNSGDSKNFKIILTLQQNQCVYIRVKANVFWRYYTMRVKQE